jgi:electron transfer flavoprotein beta subunit
MPALITVSNEVGELRYISRTKMLKMMRGARKIPTWNAEEIGVEYLTRFKRWGL